VPESPSTSVRSSVVVEAPIERAFAVFTDHIAGWWPPEHHLLEGELAGTVFEPRVGGNVYDLGVDGSECRWARVLVYEPPDRVVISWDISPEWQLETDLTKASEVEIRFVAESPGQTRVELEHRHIDRHGDGWEQMHRDVGSPEGWATMVGAFADHLALAPSRPPG